MPESYRDKDYDVLLEFLYNPNDQDLEDSYNCIQKAIEYGYNHGNNIIKQLIGCIEDTFKVASVNSKSLYNAVELKSEKEDAEFYDYINYIDQNVKGFVKKNRIYAGLAYLKDIISSIEYGFGVYFNYDDSHTILKKIVFYPYTNYYFYHKLVNPQEGLIFFNKLTECLIILLMHTKNIIPLVNFYKNLHEKISLNLKTDTLVRLIEALLKHGEFDLVESLILKLKTLEPNHPIIDIAEKTIRRAKIFNQISKTYNISIGEIQNLGGLEFEQFLENQFVKYGFKVERTKGSGDFGADLILETTSGTRAAIQAKRYKQKVNLKAVQEVVASLAHYNADFGVVITTSGYFQSAVDLAKTNNVELWDEDRLILFLSGDYSFSMLNE